MRVGKWILILLTIAISAVAVVGTVLAQADSLPPVPAPDPHVQFILGLGILAAYIARELGAMILAQLNKAGNWLDGKSNGAKRAVFAALVGAIGMGVNWVAGALTHATNWMVTFGLTILFGLLGMVTAGLTIDSVKSKMTTTERSSLSSR